MEVGAFPLAGRGWSQIDRCPEAACPPPPHSAESGGEGRHENWHLPKGMMSHLRQRLPAGLHAQPGIRHHCPAAPHPAPSGLRLQPPGNKSKARGARALKYLDQPNMSGGLPEPSWGLFGCWHWGRWKEESESQLFLPKLSWARNAGLQCAQTKAFDRPRVAAGPAP